MSLQPDARLNQFLSLYFSCRINCAIQIYILVHQEIAPVKVSNVGRVTRLGCCEVANPLGILLKISKIILYVLLDFKVGDTCCSRFVLLVSPMGWGMCTRQHIGNKQRYQCLECTVLTQASFQS